MSASARKSRRSWPNMVYTTCTRLFSGSPVSTPSCRCSGSSTTTFLACNASWTQCNSRCPIRDSSMGTFKLPDLGESLAEPEILEWHVKPGDHVVVDQPMVSVETAKAVVEVPVPFSGTVTALHGAVGDVLATGSPLIDFDSGTVVGSMPWTSDEEFVDLGLVATPTARDATRSRALPVARALAKRLGLDLGAIEGSGSDGLIRLDDVLARAGIDGCRTPAGIDAPPGSIAEPLRGARRSMAHSMSASRDQVSGSKGCGEAESRGLA